MPGTRQGADKTRFSIEIIKEKLKDSTYEVLSSHYRIASTPITVRCKICGTTVKRTWANLSQNYGCRTCWAKTANDWHTLSIHQVRVLVEKIAPMVFVVRREDKFCFLKCRTCNYQWKRRWGYIQQNLKPKSRHPVKCRKCNPRKIWHREEEVRAIVERVTRWKFPKAEQNSLVWLGNMELDGYNERHKVAFEYQGEHHYKPIFGEEALAANKRRDDKKRKRVQRAGVILLRIPYFKRDVQAYIKSKLAI